MKKRLLILFTVFILLITLIPAASAAGGDYSVTVQNSTVTFTRGGQSVGSYKAKSSDILLTTDKDNDLLVCFYDAKGEPFGVTLGSQTSLVVYGSMNSLTMDSNLSSDVRVALGSSAGATTVEIDSPITATIQGKVSTLNVNDGARITAASGASVEKANLKDSDAKLNAMSGSTVKLVSTVSGASATGSGIRSTTRSNGSSNRTTTSSKNGVYFRLSVIDADEGDRLRDLEDDLEDSVRAYVDGRRIDGDVEWLTSSSTIVRESRTYRFTFIPDSSSYKTTNGSIRVSVDGEDDDYYYDDDDYDYDNDDDYRYNDEDLYLEFDPIYTSSDNKRLSDLTDKLNSNVTAYDRHDGEVEGRCRWVNSNTRADETDNYSFIFVPDDRRYSNVRDKIRIYVNGDTEDDDDDFVSDDELEFRIDTIEISSSKRLRDLVSKLKKEVRVYNERGNRVNGTFKWVDSGSTKVTETGDYEFRFIPDSSRYDEAREWITIEVD